MAPAQAEGVLLEDDQDGPHKAKARHVMQGYSENGAEDLNSTTPQVAKDTVIYTLQILCSMAWEIGNLDFTQAFHSGDPIERELYCEQPEEGIPGAQPRQLLRLKKTCYGLTDGPYAWYKHVTKVLQGLGYVQSLADPCLFYLYSPDHLCPAEDEGSKDRLCLKECPGLTAQGDDSGALRDKECLPRRDKLCGIIALATDDMLHGGGELHWSKMEILRSKYKMGKFATGGGRFVGKEIAKSPDGCFLLHQQFYILDKMEPIPMTKERKRQRYSKCEPSEVAELRTLLGGLSWVAKETRPDVAGRVALLQQCMPTPSVYHLIEGHQILEELRKDPLAGITIRPIPIEYLRVGVVTDASWGNVEKDKQFLEEDTADYWEETPVSWVRHHVTPRRLRFHPSAAPHGPDLHSLEQKRTTYFNENEETDDWNLASSLQAVPGGEWTGYTVFPKLMVTKEKQKPINERFLQLNRTGSQGGYIVIYYDERMEYSGGLHDVTIAAWKSYKIKRCTVNTLSAECQSMIQGIGQVHWQRFMLCETFATVPGLHDWEQHLQKIPFIAVTDSRSLFDTITKCRNSSAHIDDKRTAIDLSILKSDLALSGGQVRWVAGQNMISDTLTKKMSSTLLKRIMHKGKWSLHETGFQALAELQWLWST